MPNLATLDDSLVHDDNLWIYTHALVLYKEAPQVLVFHAYENQSIYQHKQEIFDFISKKLPENYPLYACNHYRMYTSVWKLVKGEVNGKRLPRNIRNQAIKAHHAAKNEAWRVFEELSKK